MARDESALLLEALRLARAAIEAGGGPFGCVVARGGEIIGSGHNRVVLDADPTAHAEIVALRAAARRSGTHDLAGCTLYTSCEPCPMCLGAALWARVDAIVYAASREDAARGGFDDARFWAEVGRPLESRAVPMRRAQAEAGRAVFDQWLACAQRRPY